MSALDFEASTEVMPTDNDEPEIVIGSREQLFHLLTEASEVEHALMCSYLFAAFSLKPNLDYSQRAQKGAAGVA